MLLVWNTDAAATCAVAIGQVGADPTVVSANVSTACAVPVDGLVAGASYSYVPLADGVPLAAASVFAADDPSKPFVFLVFGDSGTAGADQYAVASRMLRSPADFALHTGDMIYDAGAAPDFDPKFFVPYRDLLRRLVLWPCLGNHDVVTGLGVPWRDAFYTPANNLAGTENYYSFDHGNAHVVVLDSNAATDPTSAQYVFLDTDLAASTARWKFVAFHHTIYSGGTNGSNLTIRANLVPLFEARGVDIVFMGHDHDYERTVPLRANVAVPAGSGVVYVTTGGGGQTIRPVVPSAFTAFAESVHHFTRVAIDGDSLRLQMIADDGIIDDTMTMVKGAPPPPPTCGDGLVDQASEECDGPDRTVCTGGCQPDCTCAPVCGDGVVDPPEEECDGTADAACPGGCLADCRCGAVHGFAVVADTYVDASLPDQNFGAGLVLTADASPLSVAYLRFALSGVAGRTVARAVLRLTADANVNASSPVGGTVHRISDDSWAELAATWNTRPAVDGPGLATAGAVAPSQVVDFDVTPAVTGDGDVDLAIDSTSTDGVRYRTREAGTGAPQLLVLLAPDGSATTTTATTSTTSTSGTVATTLTTTSTTTSTTIGTALTWERHVAASADDAEENATSASTQYRQVSLTSTDLELVHDLTGATCAGCDQIVGMRWTGVPVAPGTHVTAAWIQFWVDEAQSEATQLTIVGQAAPDAAAFTTTAGNVSGRARTAASVAWSVPVWTTVGDHGDAQRTPDLSTVVQEIVDGPGWASGHALALLVTGSGHRTAQAFDLNGSNPTQSALLHIETAPGATTSTSSSTSSSSTSVTTSTVSTTSSTTSSSSTSTSATTSSSTIATTSSSSTTSSSTTSTSSTTATSTSSTSPTSSTTTSSSSSTSSSASSSITTTTSSTTSSTSSTTTSSSSSSSTSSTSSSTSTTTTSRTTSTSSSTSSSSTSSTSTSTTIVTGGTAIYQAGVSGPAGSASVDTYLRLSGATTNYGTDASLYVGVANGTTKVYRSLVAFQLAGVPAGATIQSCTLTMNVTQRTSPTAGHVRRVCGERWLDGDGQGEAQATWSQWRTGQAWGAAGAGSTAACGAGGDYTTAGEVAYTPPAGTGSFTFPDLTTLCQDAVASRGGWLRLRISQDAETQTGNLLRFDSSDGATAAARPRLAVAWSGSAPASTTTSSTSTSTTTSSSRTTTTSSSRTTTTTAAVTTSVTLATSTSTSTSATVATSSSSSTSRTTTTSTSTTIVVTGGTAIYQAGVSGPAGSASVDTYLRLSAATTNYGTDPSLYVGVTNDPTKVYRTLVAFQLAGVPAGATIRSCTLTMNVTQRTSPTPGHVRRVCGEHWLDGDGQGEAQATWSEWRTGQAWGSAGAGSTAACGAGGDYTTAGEVAYTPPAGTGPFTFPDLTALCQDAVASRGGWLRLRISQDAETQTGNVLRFDSSDATTATSRPRLAVVW